MPSTKPAVLLPGRLPAELTSFVGRRRELAETRRLLTRSRLVTLTGMGGVGKTRLALRVAADVRRSFRDGAWFVELADLHEPELLAPTLMSALELRDGTEHSIDRLASYLEDRQLLLVLDNCEQLSHACAILASKLLAASPGLKVLATSRHVLGVEREQILAVPPLSMPDPDQAVGAGSATHYEAVALFVDRAQAVLSDFEIDDDNRDAVIQLCQRLEGVPLAIELAAVRVRALSVRQILDRLDDRFRLLTHGSSVAPPRQQALRAAVAWSFDLCTPAEQLLWERLSVFSGGFDLAAVDAICAEDGLAGEQVAGLLAGLIDKSVLTREAERYGPRAWYRMLETIRLYGHLRLAGTGDERTVRLRHRDYYRELAQRYDAEGFGPDQVGWFERLYREHPNLRAALEFSLSEPAEAPAALEIAAPLWGFWTAGGSLREGHNWLARALASAPEPTLDRAHALWAAAYLAMLAGSFDEFRHLLAECAELERRFDNPLLRARIAECAGQAAMFLGDLDEAVPILEDGLDGHLAAGNLIGEFDCLLLLAICHFFLDDPRMSGFSERALELAERSGADWSRSYGLFGIGIIRWREGDFHGGSRVLREAIALKEALNDRTGIAFCVEALAWCAASVKPDDHAARLMGATQAIWRVSGVTVAEVGAYYRFDELSSSRVLTAIGPAAFERAYAEGAAFSFEEAVAYAKETGIRAPTTHAASLTRREREVATLLAQGLSNKEIAARLVVSPRTAETHVENILSKLGFTSRAQVASWLAEHRD